MIVRTSVRGVKTRRHMNTALLSIGSWNRPINTAATPLLLLQNRTAAAAACSARLQQYCSCCGRTVTDAAASACSFMFITNSGCLFTPGTYCFPLVWRRESLHCCLVTVCSSSGSAATIFAGTDCLCTMVVRMNTGVEGKRQHTYRTTIIR